MKIRNAAARARQRGIEGERTRAVEEEHRQIGKTGSDVGDDRR